MMSIGMLVLACVVFFAGGGVIALVINLAMGPRRDKRD